MVIEVILHSEDVLIDVESNSPEWFVAEKDGAIVALSVKLDDELIEEGIARDTYRKTQLLRKQQGLEFENR